MSKSKQDETAGWMARMVGHDRDNHGGRKGKSRKDWQRGWDAADRRTRGEG